MKFSFWLRACGAYGYSNTALFSGRKSKRNKAGPKVKYCITSLMCIICKKVELKQQSMELDIGGRGGGEGVQRPLHCKVGKFWRPYHTEYDYR